VDLGYAPGSWSQVAVDLTSPGGRILGIDIIPAQPPRGVSTMQGNFLSPRVQEEVKKFLRDPDRGRPRAPTSFFDPSPSPSSSTSSSESPPSDEITTNTLGYIELERRASHDETPSDEDTSPPRTKREKEAAAGRMVDVVLSDMCAPWPQTDGLWKRSLSGPFYRMCNTSGLAFRDHAGSMVRCSCERFDERMDEKS
jgi:21S rRNA (uridine2791-2'-O)-methyltransferase